MGLMPRQKMEIVNRNSLNIIPYPALPRCQRKSSNLVLYNQSITYNSEIKPSSNNLRFITVTPAHCRSDKILWTINSIFKYRDNNSCEKVNDKYVKLFGPIQLLAAYVKIMHLKGENFCNEFRC